MWMNQIARGNTWFGGLCNSYPSSHFSLSFSALEKCPASLEVDPPQVHPPQIVRRATSRKTLHLATHQRTAYLKFRSRPNQNISPLHRGTKKSASTRSTHKEGVKGKLSLSMKVPY